MPDGTFPPAPGLPVMEFLELWGKSALTTLGWFWTAFWAFGLGYLVSAAIQVFVSRQRMRNAIGKTNARTVALASCE